MIRAKGRSDAADPGLCGDLRELGEIDFGWSQGESSVSGLWEPCENVGLRGRLLSQGVAGRGIFLGGQPCIRTPYKLESLRIRNSAEVVWVVRVRTETTTVPLLENGGGACSGHLKQLLWDG